MRFDSLNLDEKILKGLADAGFEKCTPVQEQALPESMLGKDIIAQAQTGTGKTAVFLLPIFNKLITEGKAPGVPRALIMVPTRELAEQVYEDAVKLGKYLPYRSLAIYGGVEYRKQEKPLSEGVDIIVATPGRLIDLYKSHIVSLDAIEQLIIDEADRMFDMGFVSDIYYIANNLPRDNDRQTILCSATIDSQVHRLALKYMKADPLMIEIEPEQITVDSIHQRIIYVSNEEKLPVLMSILKRPEAERVLIFTNMKCTAEEVGWRLEENGFPSKVLTGDINQDKRKRIVDDMKDGKIRILVATDVASRGLHIDGITHVINYDLPQEAATYVHRIGRTARAGHSGVAYSLGCEDHVINLPYIEKYIEKKIESEWIEAADMVEDKAGSYSRSRIKEDRAEEREKFSDNKGYPKHSYKDKEKSHGAHNRSDEDRHAGKKKDDFEKKRDFEKKPDFEKKADFEKKQTVKKPSNNGEHKKPSGKQIPPKSVEARLAHYKEKYGEDFTLAKGGKKRSGGILKRLFGGFGK
ncbi:MAG: DEAD/DEAH box helicase [Nitrospinae bacterium]|nr:DEAD/DEAH box helicase [Nitrospinota bacterium]